MWIFEIKVIVFVKWILGFWEVNIDVLSVELGVIYFN